jgi:hypothetical protein
VTPPVDIAGLRALVEAANPDNESTWDWWTAQQTMEAAASAAIPALCDRVEELEADLVVATDLRRLAEEVAGRLREENARLRAEVAKWREHFGEGEVG